MCVSTPFQLPRIATPLKLCSLPHHIRPRVTSIEQLTVLRSTERSLQNGAEPKRSGEGLQSLLLLVRFRPAPPLSSRISLVRYPFRRRPPWPPAGVSTWRKGCW